MVAAASHRLRPEQYHHGAVHKRFSPRRDWADVITDESSIRFTREGRFNDSLKGINRDNFTILGEASVWPFRKKNKRQLRKLARLLINMNINPKDRLKTKNLRLPVEEAPHQNEVLGTLEEISKWKI